MFVQCRGHKYIYDQSWWLNIQHSWCYPRPCTGLFLVLGDLHFQREDLKGIFNPIHLTQLILSFNKCLCPFFVPAPFQALELHTTVNSKTKIPSSRGVTIEGGNVVKYMC